MKNKTNPELFPEKIYINDISGKKMQIRIYGPESLDNQLAVITHYLHNRDTISDKTYKEDAVAFIKELVTYKYPETNLENFDAKNPLQYGLFNDIFEIPYPAPKKPSFTFIDLFAGMGGFRIAMQKQGGKCIFSSEWM